MPGSSSTDEAEARARLARALFSPSHIALVGASPDPSQLTALPQRVLRRHGYAGRIVPIHPALDEIGGERAYRSLRDAPGPIDHAFVMVPATAVPGVIADCCRAQVKVATILTTGFTELGASGARRQSRVLETARAAGLRLLGPSSLGVANVTGGMTLTANLALAHEEMRRGGLSVVSQSGSMLGGIVTRAHERGLGFSKLVAVGSECDLAVGEIVDLLVDDPDTRAILLFLETFRDAETLARAARRAFAAGKPVIALKLGRSAIGREIAASHTGALAGPDEIARAFLRAHGILRVEVLEALFETAQLVLGHRPPHGRRVAALTVSGGAAALVVDRLGLAGIELVKPTPAIVERLAARRIRIAQDAPLVDLPMGRADGGTYSAILGELTAADHCDLVLAVQGSGATHTPDVVGRRILSAPRGAKPLAVFAGPRADAALRMLQEGGVAGFRTPEACADAIRAYCDWRAPADPVAIEPQRMEALRNALEKLPRGLPDERHAMHLLAALGIACAPFRIIRRADEPVDLAFPLAAKVLAPGLAHKTDVGGVVLEIADARALSAAVDEMLGRVRADFPGIRIDGVLVQSMHRGIAEVIVGFRRDRDAGAVVMVGAGGALAELHASRALRVAPVSIETALEMIAEVPALAAISGYRNRPAGDLRSLARVIHALSLLAAATDPGVAEAEINPLIVRTEAVVAVDAFVRLRA